MREMRFWWGLGWTAALIQEPDLYGLSIHDSMKFLDSQMRIRASTSLSKRNYARLAEVKWDVGRY